jgi:hypothetical protein
VIKQLRDMSEALKHPRSLDWNSVRLKLTEETTDGPPVVGASIALTRQFQNPTPTIRRASDESGLADFGLLQPGEYSLHLWRSFEGGSAVANVTLNVQPGTEVDKQIVCPKIPPVRASVRVRWQWPADLEKDPLVLYAPFRFRSINSASGTSWKIFRTPAPKDRASRQGPKSVSPVPQSVVAHSLLCGPSGTTSQLKDFAGLFLWTIQTGNLGAQLDAAAKLGPGDFADLLERDLGESNPPGAPFDVDAGTYGLFELIALVPSRSRDIEAGRKRFDVLAAVFAPGHVHRIQLGLEPPSKRDLETPEMMITGMEPGLVQSTPSTDVPPEYWQRVGNEFEAKPGTTNEWTIPLPDELILAVRSALEAKKGPKGKPPATAEANDRKD